jgi:hypothetical protein
MSENHHRFSIHSKQTLASDDFIIFHTLRSLLSQEGQHLMCAIITFKFHPRTGHEGPEGEKRYSSTLSLTLALDGVRGQRHVPAALPPGKTKYHCTGWAPGPVWTGAENLVPTGIRSPDRPARSESLYRLRYSGPQCVP